MEGQRIKMRNPFQNERVEKVRTKIIEGLILHVVLVLYFVVSFALRGEDRGDTNISAC